MTKLFTLPAAFILATGCFGQLYNKDKVCGTDTINIDYRDLKLGRQIKYKAFECTQVAKLGIRFEFGYTSHSYDPGTKNWLSNHSGFQLGLALAHRNVNLGVKFKLATIIPKSQLIFKGDTVTYKDLLNPVKIDYYAGYSFDLKHNFSIEPYVGITRNLFNVITEKERNKTFDIPNVQGLHTGVTLNKYFKLKEFHFISVFITGGYGFSNFKKVHPSLDAGYSEWAVGLSYKVFAKNRFHDKIQ